jgi:hypothetical protein
MKNTSVLIKVSAYAGYKGEETPRKVEIQGKLCDVVEVKKAWLEPGKRFFDLTLSGYNDDMRIYYDEKAEDWFLCRTI